MASAMRTPRLARHLHRPTPAVLVPLEARLYLYDSPLSDWPVTNNRIGLNGTLLYVADDGVHGAEMWRTDGTQAATRMVKEIRPGASGFIDQGSNYNSDAQSVQLVVLGSTVYFRADDGVHGPELWRTDGTASGTSLMRDF